ncbi:hypothetical protein G6011_03794 [Alternaria panax]|uniref:Nudix hydrolase domain-containing protein n=1 Tax=Alternaria panax TaxID=48097 RepID=A0AAD4IFT7_9PLEO|nr:hypothetical protein G6011_03794 [Alternaria panax]
MQGNPFALGFWAGELFPIYSAEDEHMLDLDSSGVNTFGIVNYSCHLIAYVTTDDGLRYWVPRRTKTKLTFPAMLDNRVVESLTSGETRIDCVVRECLEEASIPTEYTRANIRFYGSLSYQMTQADDGRQGHQHQVQYLCEIEIPEDAMPVPCDQEVQSFHLMALDKVVSALRNGEFKLNCAMTWMAFFYSAWACQRGE